MKCPFRKIIVKKNLITEEGTVEKAEFKDCLEFNCMAYYTALDLSLGEIECCRMIDKIITEK